MDPINKAQDELKNQQNDFERCSIGLVEVRANGEGQELKISGYAAVFNQLSNEIFGFREEVAPGAFADSLRDDDQVDLLNHDPNYVMGRKSNGTLRLWEDNFGLAFEVTPPDTQWARDLVTSIRRGDIKQMSFSFRPISDTWRMEDEVAIRTLHKLRLFDVSQVTFPVYPQTSANVRSAFEAFKLNQIGNQNGQEPAEELKRSQAQARLGNQKRLLDLAEI